MKKYSAKIETDDSNFNLVVDAKNDHQAIKEVHSQMNCRGIASDDISFILVEEM